MKQGSHIVTLNASDLKVQIIPFVVDETPERKAIPREDQGYIVPVRTLFADTYGDEFSGILEVSTLYFNESIRRDILDALRRDSIKFDLYIRQKNDDDARSGPKTIQTYEGCSFYRAELMIPEVGLPVSYRYHFSNSEKPWEIDTSRISELRMPNQYFYDYAVSKAIKDLRLTLEPMSRVFAEKFAKKTVTASEYVKEVRQEQE